LDQWYVERHNLRTGESQRILAPGHANTRKDLRGSHNGRFFAYVDAPNQPQITRLWILRVEDEEAFPVTNGMWNDRSPSWSVDESFLYFISNRGGAMDLWRLPIADDGSAAGEPEPLTTGIGIRQAMFSPDGKKLAYSRGRRMANLWSVPILEDRPATWADAEQLTFDHALVEFVDVSPDGDRLVVSSDRAGNPDLWILPTEGGEMRQLTTDPTPDWLPDWSPEGTEIAFYAYRSGNRDIWVMSASGAQARRITHSTAPDLHPSWSPDGAKLAFWSTRNGNTDIYTVSVSSGETQRITDHPAGDYHPKWSPDGKWLVFWSGREQQWALWQALRSDSKHR
jgi:Tol biopolymer transport system component